LKYYICPLAGCFGLLNAIGIMTIMGAKPSPIGLFVVPLSCLAYLSLSRFDHMIGDGKTLPAEE
jgi:hypothetical protein